MEDEAWYKAIINKNVRNKSICQVLSVNEEMAVPKGSNYASVICRVTLEVMYKSGCKSRLSFITKKTPEAQDKAQVTESLSLFKNEIKVYSEIFAKFEQLMEDYQDYQDKFWSNLITFKPYSLIVLEDLKKNNFQMANRKQLLDVSHTMLVMNTLGRFHAMGHVLIKKGQLNSRDLQPHYMEIDSPIIINLIVGGLKTLRQVMENDWPPEWKETAERLSKQEDVIMKKLKKLFILPENCFLTLDHGDCWTCNMLFKYCPYDEKLPVAVKFLDFQTSHINSYGFDVIHFLYNSVNPEFRRFYFDKFLQEYQISLKSTLALYGMEDEAPTIPQINEEMKRIQYYGLAINLIYLPMTIAEQNDPIRLENLNKDRDGMDAYNPEIFKSQKYRASVEQDLKKWLEEGLY